MFLETWYVDCCEGGGLSTSGDILDVGIDREECQFVVRDFRFEALPVKYTFRLRMRDGRIANGSVMSPKCIIDLCVNPISAEPLDMECTLEWETSPGPASTAA